MGVVDPVPSPCLAGNPNRLRCHEMTAKTKELCNWKQSTIEKELDTVRKIVAKPKYLCRKCGRAVRDKQYICKPVKL